MQQVEVTSSHTRVLHGQRAPSDHATTQDQRPPHQPRLVETLAQRAEEAERRGPSHIGMTRGPSRPFVDSLAPKHHDHHQQGEPPPQQPHQQQQDGRRIAPSMQGPSAAAPRTQWLDSPPRPCSPSDSPAHKPASEPLSRTSSTSSSCSSSSSSSLHPQLPPIPGSLNAEALAEPLSALMLTPRTLAWQLQAPVTAGTDDVPVLTTEEMRQLGDMW